MNLIFCHSKKKCKNRWKCPNPKFWVHFHPSKIFFFAKKDFLSVSIYQKPLKKHWDIWFWELLQFSTLPKCLCSTKRVKTITTGKQVRPGKKRPFSLSLSLSFVSIQVQPNQPHCSPLAHLDVKIIFKLYKCSHLINQFLQKDLAKELSWWCQDTAPPLHWIRGLGEQKWSMVLCRVQQRSFAGWERRWSVWNLGGSWVWGLIGCQVQL